MHLGAGDYMGKSIDLTGKRFGFWIVLSKGCKGKNNQTQYLCKCECSKERLVSSNSLRTGNSTSCGCNHVPELLGHRFSKLLVVELAIDQKKGRRVWVCKCDCANLVMASTYQLRNNKMTSCGSCNKTKTINNTASSISLFSIENKIKTTKKTTQDLLLKMHKEIKNIENEVNKLTSLEKKLNS